MAFIFGAPGLAKSPEELARQREVQQALTAKLLGHTPQNVGEGLSAIGQALAIRGMRSRNEKAAEKGRESAAAAFNPLLAALTGGGDFPAAPKEAPDYTPGAVTGAPLADPVSERVAKAFGPIGDSQEAFVSSLMPAAMEASKRTGVDPRIIIAQAAQETGWGKHAPGNNFFGIKSHGQAGGNKLATTEYVDGKPQTQMAAFRAYDSPSDSVSGYADFLLANPRYKPMMQAQGLDAQIAALGQSGYATDPNYANSVGAIARSIELPGQGAQQPVQTAQNGPIDPATLPAMAGGAADVIPQGQQQNLLPLLIKASQNPWLTESQRGIVGALLKKELEGEEPQDLINAGKGRIYNPNSGEWIVAPGVAAPNEAPTVKTFYDDKGQEYKAQWNPATREWDQVGGVKAPSNGVSVTSPDGTTIRVGGKLTEAQSKDVVFYTRGADANSRLDDLEGQLTDFMQTNADLAPLGLGNYARTPEFRQAKQAADSFLAAVLRKDTGAAITPKEFELYGPMFLPIPGDDPATIQQKKRAREVALLAIRGGLGTADAIAAANRVTLGLPKDEPPLTPFPENKTGGTTSGGLKWSIEP